MLWPLLIQHAANRQGRGALTFPHLIIRSRPSQVLESLWVV